MRVQGKSHARIHESMARPWYPLGAPVGHILASNGGQQRRFVAPS
jgi:hypothetical protein